MTDKNTYWIRDTEGAFAQVVGAEAHDLWTRVRGWFESGEPGPNDQVHVINEHPEVGPGRLPYGAVEGHAGRGWKVGPPPEVAGATESPAPAEEPAKPTKAAAPAAGEQKEK